MQVVTMRRYVKLCFITIYTGSRLSAQFLARSSRNDRKDIAPWIGRIVTPLKYDIWLKELRDHPDRQLTKLIGEGIQNGFRIGYAIPSRAHPQT